MSLASRGNDFEKFLGANKLKIELIDRKRTQQPTLLAKSFCKKPWFGHFGVRKSGVFTLEIF